MLSKLANDGDNMKITLIHGINTSKQPVLAKYGDGVYM
jgi:hypothetical protein